MEEDLFRRRLREARATDLAPRWERLQAWLKQRFTRTDEVSIEHVLFLIGVQARGRGFEPELEKEIKQDLIMEGTCEAFERIGLYERIGMEHDGRWVWQRTAEPPDDLAVDDQETLLKYAILAYFDEVLEE